MKKIIAINASPRTGWNTAQLVKEAGLGAKGQNATVKVIDLYKLDKFTGCISCFGCKMPANLGKCICKDGLTEVLEEKEYIIKSIVTDDEDLNAFLFSLGCYSGEPITVVSRKKKNCVVSIKDGRYNIDNELAAAIEVEA